jgi:hypothetical protein
LVQYRSYDVTRDGERFLMIKNAERFTSAAPVTMTVVLNWTEELKQRAPE